MVAVAVGSNIIQRVVAIALITTDGAAAIAAKGTSYRLGFVLATGTLAVMGIVLVGGVLCEGMVTGFAAFAGPALGAVAVESAVLGFGYLTAGTLSSMGAVSVGSRSGLVVTDRTVTVLAGIGTSPEGRGCGTCCTFFHSLLTGTAVNSVGIVIVAGIGLLVFVVLAVCGHGSHRQQGEECCQDQKHGNKFLFHSYSTS